MEYNFTIITQKPKYTNNNIGVAAPLFAEERRVTIRKTDFCLPKLLSQFIDKCWLIERSPPLSNHWNLFY